MNPKLYLLGMLFNLDVQITNAFNVKMEQEGNILRAELYWENNYKAPIFVKLESDGKNLKYRVSKKTYE